MVLIIGGAFQGKYSWAAARYEEKNIWNNFHLFVSEKLAAGKSAEEIKVETMNKIAANVRLVVISDEIGCGIVPLTEEDRNYRELTGRLLCQIAENAEAVYRMTCGVAQKIK